MDVLPYILGISLGVFSGLIPGVGNFVLMLLVWPFLVSFNINELLIMYVSMAAISQYVGSIPAVIYSIPGESSSYPVVTESKLLVNHDQVSNAISGSAFGSLFGGLVVLLLSYWLSEYTYLIKYFYSTKLLVGLLLVVSLMMIFTVNNRWYINSLLIVTGLLLGSVGYNSYTNTEFLTLGLNTLWSGLPMPVVLICLFAIPQIFRHLTIDTEKTKARLYKLGHLYILNPLALTASSIIGFFGGLVPGLTTVFSSTSAYIISQFFTKDPVKRIIVSETANNAGAFSMLLPLLIFGIPLIGSEAILLFLMEQKGFNVITFNFQQLLPDLAFSLLIINLVGFFIAWPLSKCVPFFYKINIKNVMIGVLLVLMFTIVYLGFINYTPFFYIFLFIVLAPIGAMLRNIDTLPLVFAFIIQDKLFSGLFRLHQLI